MERVSFVWSKKMKAMKQVVPGKSLPVLYLTNSRAYDVDSSDDEKIRNGVQRYWPPIPAYRIHAEPAPGPFTTDFDQCVIRWHFEWRERFRMLDPRKRKVPVKPIENSFSVGNHLLRLRQLPARDWIRFLVTGDVWQTMLNVNGSFEPLALNGSITFPFKFGSQAGPLPVLLAGDDMRDDEGLGARGFVVALPGGKYGIAGRSELGEFDSENKAIAGMVKEVRPKCGMFGGRFGFGGGKRLWNNADDALSYKGKAFDEFELPALLCPACERALLPDKTNASLTVLQWGCNSCGKRFVVTDRHKGTVGPAEDQ